MPTNTVISEKSVKKEWNELYGNFPLESLPWYSERPVKPLVDLLRRKSLKGKKALDVGCGAGSNTLYLAAKGVVAAGADVSIEAIRLAKSRMARKKLKGFFAAADASQLPFKNEVFDFILDRGCFHHIEPFKRLDFIGEMRRVLSPQGCYLMLCFSDKNPERENTFSRQDLKAYFGGYFKIQWIRPSIFKEFGRLPRFFNVAFMQKKAAPINS